MSIRATIFAILMATLTSASLAYEEIDVANGASLSGKVSFTGEDPAPATYTITKDNEVCGEGDRQIDFIKVSDGGLGDVVVYLDKVKSGKPFPPKSGIVEQKGCEFAPFLSIMHNAENLQAVNEDPVLHNIHTYEIIGRAKKTVFNVSQPNQGTVSKKVKLRRGAAMKVECDAHDFMHSFVFVAKNPYYAVVAKDGTFSIDNIPAGDYTVKSWHGTLGDKKTKITLSAGSQSTVDFSYSK